MEKGWAYGSRILCLHQIPSRLLRVWLSGKALVEKPPMRDWRPLHSGDLVLTYKSH